MNFKRKIMCLGLLGLISQSVIGSEGVVEVVKEATEKVAPIVAQRAAEVVSNVASTTTQTLTQNAPAALRQVGSEAASEISGASLEQLPWLYRWMMYHSYKAGEDAAAMVPRMGKACWDYAVHHPLGAANITLGGIFVAWVYYKWNQLQQMAERIRELGLEHLF